ncbi:MAG: c-type cytochrome [Thermaerobacter sp.]|nr:c-type cytochrome [Thermaerobacter sp.]
MRIFTGIAVATLCIGLIAGGCSGKQGAAGKSSSKQSQSAGSKSSSGKSSSSSSSKGSKSKSKGKDAASSKKGSQSSKSSTSSKSGSSTAAAPPTTGTTTQTGNPTGSNAQAAALFQQKCQVCHGANGKGATAPKLDAGLITRFQTQAALQSFIQKNMPFNNPGSLTQAQSGSLARYLWSMQKP